MINNRISKYFHSDYRVKVFKNMGWLLFDRISRITVGMFLGGMIAKYLGVEAFGSLSYALAFIAIFSAVVNFGLDSIVVKEFSNNENNQKQILYATLIIRSFLALIAITACIVTIFYTKKDGDIVRVLVIILGVGLLLQPLESIDLLFQARIKSKITVIFKSLAFWFASLLKFYAIKNNFDIYSFAWISLIEMLIGYFFLSVAYFKSMECGERYKLNIREILSLIKSSYPLFISGLLIIVYTRIDQILVGELSNNYQLGLYSVATRFYEIWYMIPGIIISSVYPYFSKLYLDNRDKFYEKLQKIFSLMALISLCIILFTFLISPKIIDYLFGVEYRDSYYVLYIQIIGLVFVFFGSAQSLWTIPAGKQKYGLFQTFVGAIFNISANIILIPKYGALGAAIATVITQFIAAYILNYFYAKEIFKIQTRAFILYAIK